jgi:hypothetical protein
MAFWSCTVLLYLPAYQGGFYEDILGIFHNQQNLSFWECLTKKTSGLYYGIFFFLYCCISLFGTHPLPWFLLFTGMHALTAVCIARFCKGMFRLWRAPYPKGAVLTGVLFWLLSPLAVETVNWKACSHYMISMILLFSILKWVTDYLILPRGPVLIKVLLAYILSLFFLELFYLTPLFIALLLVALAYCRVPLPLSKVRAAAHFLLPLAVLWGLYYLALQAATGRSLARVNSVSELLDPIFLLAKLGKYIIHIYFMEYFLPAGSRSVIYRFMEQYPVIIGFGILLATVVVLRILRMRKAGPAAQISTVLLLMFLASLVFILPMWFFELFPYQGSRYFYLPGAFGYLLLSLLISRISRLAIRYAITGFYLCCSIAGTFSLVKTARDAAQTAHKLMDNFKWDREGDILLLNLPALYRGVGIIGAGHPSNFAYHLEVLKGRKISSRIYDVSSFNMAGRWDGAHVQIVDSTQLKVILNQYGTWWWYGGFGAADYENELYKVTFNHDTGSYLLQFKKMPAESTVILYQSGGDWKRVNWHKKEEQW